MSWLNEFHGPKMRRLQKYRNVFLYNQFLTEEYSLIELRSCVYSKWLYEFISFIIVINI